MKLYAEVVGEKIQKLKGGVIMDVTNPEQARIAESAGACAVMVGTANFVNPTACVDVAKGIESYMEKYGHADLDAFRGNITLN